MTNEITEDEFGNPIQDGEYVDGRIIYCVHPHCGCDGARLCMAENGASDRAFRQNVEQMYNRKDPEALRARRELIQSVMRESSK